MNKIIKFIKQKLFEPRVVTVASNTLQPEEIRAFLGPKAENLNNEEMAKIFGQLPVEDQMKAFFGKK